jgi:hypothetical protein
MNAGANDGFSIRDDQELNGVVLQTFATREAATNKPELVITYG